MSERTLTQDEAVKLAKYCGLETWQKKIGVCYWDGSANPSLPVEHFFSDYQGMGVLIDKLHADGVLILVKNWGVLLETSKIGIPKTRLASYGSGGDALEESWPNAVAFATLDALSLGGLAGGNEDGD